MYSAYTEWKLTEFGEYVENLRKQKKMTKTELSKRLGITVTYYNFIIYGQRPGYCQRVRIIKLLTEELDKEAS